MVRVMKKRRRKKKIRTVGRACMKLTQMAMMGQDWWQNGELNKMCKVATGNQCYGKQLIVQTADVAVPS